MRIHNLLPLLKKCIQQWEKIPTESEFIHSYFNPIKDRVGIVFDDDGSLFYQALKGLNWKAYRAETLGIDPEKEENRLKHQICQVEQFFEIPLKGESILFGAFTWMDGYARFDQGTHQVFLGVDESHGRGAYLDILIAHELTHVIRESRQSVWTGFGLDPKMTHSEFTENLPVIEHLMNEGLSCLVSEILVPNESPWHYAYQTKDGLLKILEHGPSVDRIIKEELIRPDGDYSRLYRSRRYGKTMPTFCHYVWAWQWVKRVLREEAKGDLRGLISKCSQEFLQHALEFKLERIE